MFDDTFYITHRLAGRQDLGKQRARDGRSVCFEEKRAFSKLIVRLTGFWSRTPDSHIMAIILKDCLLRITDERRYRRQLEDAVRRPQHRAQERRNRPLGGMTPLVGINHSHASAGVLIPLAPVQWSG